MLQTRIGYKYLFESQFRENKTVRVQFFILICIYIEFVFDNKIRFNHI
jgi:hypothetical protein